MEMKSDTYLQMFRHGLLCTEGLDIAPGSWNNFKIVDDN